MQRLSIVAVLIYSFIAPGHSQCVGAGSWADKSACIQTDVLDCPTPDATVCTNTAAYNAESFHCPWESAGLSLSKKWGGCANVKYVCNKMNFNSVLQAYAPFVSTGGAPDGYTGPEMTYVSCCITQQCVNSKSPAEAQSLCGTIPRARLFDAKLPEMMKTTTGIQALAAGMLAFVMVTAGVAFVAMRIRRPSLQALELDEESEAGSGLD